MRYVVAGYVIVLSVLFLYGVHLAWRRRRVVRAAERVVVSRAAATASATPPTSAVTPSPLTTPSSVPADGATARRPG